MFINSKITKFTNNQLIKAYLTTTKHTFLLVSKLKRDDAPLINHN